MNHKLAKNILSIALLYSSLSLAEVNFVVPSAYDAAVSGMGLPNPAAAAAQGNGLSTQTQQQAVSSPTANQAAGLSGASTQDANQALNLYGAGTSGAVTGSASYNAEAAWAKDSAPAGGIYIDPSLSDPVPKISTITENTANDINRSPANDPNLVRDVQNNAISDLQKNGKGGYVPAAQRMNTCLDNSADPTSSYQCMKNTQADNGYGTPTETYVQP